MKKLTLKEMGLHYQKTGEFLPEAQAAQDRYIKRNMKSFKKSYKLHIKRGGQMSESAYISLCISDWQIRYGFHRSFRDIVRAIPRKKK